MRRELLYGVAAIAIAVAYQSQPVAAADHSTWTGFYIGGHLGAGKSSWDGQWDPSESPGVLFDDVLGEGGIIGGMQVGYNYQLPKYGMASFVLGAELDVSAIGGMVTGDRIDNLRGSESSFCHPEWTAQCGSQIDWLASLRARLGIALSPVLLYGTVGPAFAGARAFVGSSSSGQIFDFNDTGIAWGGGVEWMLAPNFVLGAEYLTYDFGDEKKIKFEACGFNHKGCDPNQENIEFDSVSVIRLRASYHFSM